ncbi:MAG: hypothetical protein AAF514_11475 [Verrucomicrobiota bacterium]
MGPRFSIAVLLLLIAGPVMGGSGSADSEMAPFADDGVDESSNAWAFLTDARPRLDTSFGTLWANGVFLSESSLAGKLEHDQWDLGFTVGHNRIELDYDPEIFGSPFQVREDTLLFSLDSRMTLADGWNVIVSGSHYDGYSDYRSLWISEYYEQLFGEVPGYQDPSPQGYSGSVGVEWQYIPVMGKIRMSAGYGRDTIAPAYDFGENGLESGRPRLYSKNVRLQADNVINKRMAVQNTIQYSDTTNREVRWSYQGSLNWAIRDSLTLRAYLGGAKEEPRFEAAFVGATLEYALTDSWFARISGRYYTDTGEIENSLGGFNSSAPALDAFQIGAGLRWEGASSAVNLFLAFYDTSYNSLSEDNAFLKNLYRDRQWGILQLSYTRQF